MLYKIIIILMLFLMAQTAPAQAAIVFNGISIGPEQKAMLQAAQYVMKNQFREAEALYSQVIGMNDGFIEAYLQRSVVRRELGNVAASQSDAVMAVRLTEMKLKDQPQNARLYYQRGTGYRLLRQFPQARKDIETAISLSGNNSWRGDLQAMALEEKIAQ